jgi:phage terminase large subunit
MRTDEDLFAKQVYALGTWYNSALVAIETNLSTYPVMELERLSYPNQYVRETMDDYTHQLRRAFGFRTDLKTRPVIIAELIRAVREDIGSVCDSDTLSEMLTFVRNENYRPEAESGAHDDCVMALAIAHHVRPFQSVLACAEPTPGAEWSESMVEDYRRATPEEREYMLEKWGRPK